MDNQNLSESERIIKETMCEFAQVFARELARCLLPADTEAVLAAAAANEQHHQERVRMNERMIAINEQISVDLRRIRIVLERH